MKIFIKTYGCQMNERDSEAFAGMLTASGHTMVSSETEAEVLIFNTCSVREQAERKALGKISAMKKLKAQRPDLIIGATGCMAQRLGNELFKLLPHLDFVLGTGQLHTLNELIESIKADRRQIAALSESEAVLTGMGSHFYATDSHPWHGQIAITRGCNRFCSYCIVPYVRGREISRDLSDILSEARELVNSGVKEIMLLGQNVAAYGLNGNVNPPPEDYSPFAELLEELDKIPELLRLRFTSPYPTYFNQRLIDSIARSRTVCHSIHLPLQSGSDTILKAMNRQYTSESYWQIVQRLRRAMPDVAFSTDIIVGFPGETDEEFNQTRELMARVEFDNAFIFKYSPRPGAKSANLLDSVPQSVKEERNQILLNDQRARLEKLLKSQVGTIQQVLVEGVSPRNPERWCGRTVAGRLIHFNPQPGIQSGTLRNVKVTRAGSVSLTGELL